MTDPYVELVIAAKPVIMAAMRKYYRSPLLNDREDVMQEVYISLYRLWKTGKFLKIENPESYIYTLTKNQCLAIVTKRGVQLVEASAEYLESMATEVTGFSADDKEALDKAVQELPEKYRTVIHHVLQGYSLVELSEKWNTSINTIKSLYHRAKGQLAGVLSQERNS